MGRWTGRTLPVFLVLATVATTFAAAMLFVAQARRITAEEALKIGWQDSVAGVVFGFEREFGRFRGELAADARAPLPAGIDELSLRYELLVSRIHLLETTAALESMRATPQYAAMIERVRAIVARGDVVFADRKPGTVALTGMLRQMDEATASVQDFSRTASAALSGLVENQSEALTQQAIVIGVLAVLQMLVLGAGGWLLHVHLRKKDAARLKLEALAAQLEEARREAEAANRTKSQFLANMSHELRTPFQGVIGMLQLLEQSRPTARQEDLIRTASESANHLLALLNDVLDLSAIEEGRVVLERATLDLHRCCRDVHDLMRGQAAKRGLRLQTQMARDVPRWVEGDVTRIKQVLFNLLGNAIKFTPSGDVTLDVAIESGRQVRFSVRDTGIGMDQPTMDRLFRRFEMGEDGLSRRFGGAGLGLEISRNLARQMGGDIVVSSQLGRGSCFAFSAVLPACRTPLASPAVAPAPHPARALRLLVVDDHPINRKYLALVLESMGHTVALCDDGAQALRRIRQHEFDAVLMDVHMPVMDGPTATAAVRALGGKYRELPILLLTADVMSSTRERAERSGVTAYLQKPVQAAHLAAALEAAVHRPHTSSEVAAAAREDAVSSRFAELAAQLPGEHLHNLVDMFFQDESGTISGLREKLACGEAASIRDSAHKLKGSARLLGFRQVAEVAEEIERLENEAPAASAWSELQARLARAIDETRAAVKPARH